MRKRKEHDAPSRTIPIGILALALGLLLLGGFSVFGMWQLANMPPTISRLPTPTPLPSMQLQPTVPPRPYSTPTPIPTQPPRQIARPAVGQIVVSVGEPKRVGFLDANGAHDANFAGDNVALSPDGQTLAFTRDDKLYVRHTEDKQETLIAEQARMPAWNGDGTAVAYIVNGTDGTQAIYQIELGKPQAVRLWVSQNPLVAPPHAVPGRRKLLVVELIEQNKTEFYTIDSTCLSFEACKNTRNDIAAVPYRATWADYHPSGTFIGYTEPEGRLYVLTTAKGKTEIKQLMNDHRENITQFAFSPDGKRLIYLTNSRLIIAPLDGSISREYIDPSLSPGWDFIFSVDWAGR
jgi:hypothetical protein